MRTDKDGLIPAETLASLAKQERYARTLQGIEMRRLGSRMGEGFKRARPAVADVTARAFAWLAASTQARAEKLQRSGLFYE